MDLRLDYRNPDITVADLIEAGYVEYPASGYHNKDYLKTISDPVTGKPLHHLGFKLLDLRKYGHKIVLTGVVFTNFYENEDDFLVSGTFETNTNLNGTLKEVEKILMQVSDALKRQRAKE